MIKKVIAKIVSIIPLFFIEKYLLGRFGYNLLSYSQYGEDVVLRNIFIQKKDGFFVDVGAHHPTKFSNTYWLYRKGWSGINIDAAPGSMEAFRAKRPRDISIETAISDVSENKKFFVFNNPALNTFSEKLASEHKQKGYKILEEADLETKTLKEVLDQNITPERHIDLMNIDVESLDWAVLNSNDWQKYRPDVIIIEDKADSQGKTRVDSFLEEKGYHLIATLFETKIFSKLQ